MNYLARFMFTAAIGLALFLVMGGPLHAQALRLYRVSFQDAADLAAMAAMLDVWEVDHQALTVLAPLTDAQAADLRLQRRIELDADQTPLHIRFAPTDVSVQGSGIPGFACYRTVEETAATLADLVAVAPHLARLVTIGSSWEQATSNGASGHDLQVLVVTNRATSGPKPIFVLMGALHARELTTAETAVRFTEDLLTGYGSDPVATWLLDHAELHVLPMANPDGRKRAEEGLLWRKNTNASAGQCSTFYGSYGVDLNRNNSFQWNSCPGCSSGIPCSDIYRGTNPASEPETAAIENYLRSVIITRRAPDFTSPVALDTPGLLISLHSYGRLILYPWGWTKAPTPNHAALRNLALKFGYHTDYRVCQAGADNCLYPTDGTTDDWAYGELGIPAYTFELGTSFFQNCAVFESDILPSAITALRYAFLVAASPYTQPAGPDIVELSVTPGDDGTLLLDLQADATRYAGDTDLPPAQSVAAARYALNAAPWKASTPTWSLNLRAASSPHEPTHFSTPLETRCLPTGRHTIVAQAMNQSGDWGAPDMAFIEGAGDDTIQADWLSARTTVGVPVEQTLAITNTGHVTATYSLTPISGAWEISLPNATVGPLPPGESTSVPVVVIPPNQSAGAIAPAVVEIRSVQAPDSCLYVVSTTQVDPWTVRMPFVFSAND